MNVDEINARLVQAAAGGAAERSQMIDAVTNEETMAALGARSALNGEAERDRDYLQAWGRVAGNFTAIDAVELEVRMAAKWSGIDQALVEAGSDYATHARPELPSTIHTARDAIDAFAGRAQTALAGSPDGAKAPDDPSTGQNRTLNRALTRDLQYRVDRAYSEGYRSRLRSGEEWLNESTAGRTTIEANTLAARVEAYGALDQINDTVASEFDFDDQLRDPDTYAQQFLPYRVDVALVDAGFIAGRWSGTDPVIDSQLDVLASRTAAIDAAPQVTDQNVLEVRFGFDDQTLRAGDAGLVGMTRAQTEKAAVALAASANAAARDGLDDVRNVLQAQRGSGRTTTAGERRYEPPSAGPANELER